MLPAVHTAVQCFKCVSMWAARVCADARLVCVVLPACRPPEVVHDTDGLGSGCVLCHEPDFLRGAFGDRTIILCDTCEREFHVGCLREHNRADLKEVRV